MSTEEAGTAAEDNYFAKKRHGAAKAIQDKFRERSGEYAYEKMVIDGDAEERKRAIRLARIREREKELQVLRSLPAESVQNWSDFRRKRASKTIQRAWRGEFESETDPEFDHGAGGVSSSLRRSRQQGPVGRERLRVATAVIRAEQQIAVGIDEELQMEAEEGREYTAPHPSEPGAIRLANLQHQIQLKTIQRLEERDKQKENERAKALENAGNLTPRRRSRLRQQLGATKGSAQERYQKLLELRQRAKIQSTTRLEVTMSGEEYERRRERSLLVKRSQELLDKLTTTKELKSATPSSMQLTDTGGNVGNEDANDPLLSPFPLPKGPRLERARKRHETTLGAMQIEKPWWRVVRNGNEADVRELARPNPWSQWKNVQHRDKNDFLAPAVSKVEPALGEKDVETSDWWLNYALGALAGSKAATAAVEVAENVNKGHSFDTFVDRAERKIFNIHRNQILKQALENDRQALPNGSILADDLSIDDRYLLGQSPGSSPENRGKYDALSETLRELEMPFEASEMASHRLAWNSDLDDSDVSESEDTSTSDRRRQSENINSGKKSRDGKRPSSSPGRGKRRVVGGLNYGQKLNGDASTYERSSVSHRSEQSSLSHRSGQNSRASSARPQPEQVDEPINSNRSQPSDPGPKSTPTSDNMSLMINDVSFKGNQPMLSYFREKMVSCINLKIIGCDIIEKNPDDSFLCEVYRGENLVYSTKRSGGSSAEWHETVCIANFPGNQESSTDDGSVSISVKGESETPLGAASLDEEIIENGCKTQDIVKLKLSNKIGSISVAMNRVNKVPNLKAELELQSMPSKTTVESQNIDVGADEICIQWAGSAVLKTLRKSTKAFQCLLRLSDNDACRMVLMGAQKICKGNATAELKDKNSSSGIHGDLHMNLGVVVEPESSNRTGTLGTTLPLGVSAHKHGKHRRHVTVHGVETFQDGPGADQASDAKNESVDSVDLGVKKIDAFLLRYAEAMKTKGVDLLDDLFEHWVAEDKELYRKWKVSKEVELDVSITYQDYFTMLFKLVESVETSDWLDKLSDVTLSKSLAIMTIDDGKSKSGGKITLRSFFNYIATLQKESS